MKKELLLCSMAGFLLTGISGCSGNEPWSDSAYTLQKEDIKVDYPEAGFTANAGQRFPD